MSARTFNPNVYVTIAEAATMTGLTRWTIYRAAENLDVLSVRYGKVLLVSVSDVVDMREVMQRDEARRQAEAIDEEYRELQDA